MGGGGLSRAVGGELWRGVRDGGRGYQDERPPGDAE